MKLRQSTICVTAVVLAVAANSMSAAPSGDILAARVDQLVALLNQRSFVGVVTDVERVPLANAFARDVGTGCQYQYVATVQEKLKTELEGRVAFCTFDELDEEVGNGGYFVIGMLRSIVTVDDTVLPYVATLQVDGEAAIPVQTFPPDTGLPDTLYVRQGSIFSWGQSYVCDAFTEAVVVIGGDLYVRISMDRVRGVFDEGFSVADYRGLCE